MRKKTKMANICRSLRTKIFFSPVLKSPTHIGFSDVKKKGSKISHLGTFKGNVSQGKNLLIPSLTKMYSTVLYNTCLTVRKNVYLCVMFLFSSFFNHLEDE